MQQDLTLMAQLFKLWAWFENNRKPATWILGGIIIVGCGTGYFMWSRGAREVAAAQALSQAIMNTALARTTNAGPEFMKVASQYQGTDAAGYALVQAATAQFAAGDYEEAQKLFLRVSREYPRGLLGPQASLGVAVCLDAQGKVPEAFQAYKSAADRYQDSVIVPQARFSQARLLESQGKLEEAMTLYELVMRTVGMNSNLGSEAGIRGAEIQRRIAAMKPAPVAAPAVPATTPLTISPGTNAH